MILKQFMLNNGNFSAFTQLFIRLLNCISFTCMPALCLYQNYENNYFNFIHQYPVLDNAGRRDWIDHAWANWSKKPGLQETWALFKHRKKRIFFEYRFSVRWSSGCIRAYDFLRWFKTETIGSLGLFWKSEQGRFWRSHWITRIAAHSLEDQ